jgi:hypothetical protein
MAEHRGVAFQFLEQPWIRPEQLNRFPQSRWRARHKRCAAHLNGALVPGFLARERAVTDNRKTEGERFRKRDRTSFCDEEVRCHHLQMNRLHVAENANSGSLAPSPAKAVSEHSIGSAHDGNLNWRSERAQGAERAAKSTEPTLSTSHQHDGEWLVVELKQLASP